MGLASLDASVSPPFRRWSRKPGINRVRYLVRTRASTTVVDLHASLEAIQAGRDGSVQEVQMRKLVRGGLVWAAIAALMVFSSGIASASTSWG
jgi:hypothetical protein